MPSEQAAGKPKFCSDIYAVGMIGIEALTGIKAGQFPQDLSSGEIIWKDQVNVSDKLSNILDKMLWDYWKHRYQSVDEVMIELGNIGNNYVTHQSLPTTILIDHNQPHIPVTLPPPLLALKSSSTPALVQNTNTVSRKSRIQK